MILSLYKFAFLVVLIASTTDIASASSTMESSSLRGGNGVSASRDGNTSELARLFFLSSSAITDTARKLLVGCASTGTNDDPITIEDPITIVDPCDNEEYYPMKCKGNRKKFNKAYFRTKCQARLAGYTVSEDGGVIGFVEGDECKLIDECHYSERGRNTDPFSCDDGSTVWPDQCVAEKFGKCKF